MEHKNNRKGRFLTIENVKGMILCAGGAAIWIMAFIGALQAFAE